MQIIISLDGLYRKEVTVVGFDSHVNLHINYTDGKVKSFSCDLTHAAAAALGELLIEASGLPQPSQAPPTSTRAKPRGKQAYKGNGNHEWETVLDEGIDDEGDLYDGMERLRVPGGWLYRSCGASAMTFVPLTDAIGYDI